MEKEDGEYMFSIPGGNLRSLPGFGDSQADLVWHSQLTSSFNRIKAGASLPLWRTKL
jgi:hypothetical protein